MLSNRNLFRGAFLASAFAIATFASGATARTYTILHYFAGGRNDGFQSVASVQFGSVGNLYGTTYLGGASEAGTIFKIAMGGSYMVLHSFDGASGGGRPGGAVTIDPSSGDLYGTTQMGGNTDACGGLGCGVIWKLAADGTFTVLHRFDPTDGDFPAGDLTPDKRGNLYGVAVSGGANGDGTVFVLKANGGFKVLHAFAGTDGATPDGKLVSDRAGNLYGVTLLGGISNSGTVYRLSSDGTAFTTLHDFTGGPGGPPGAGLDRDKKGNLYGMTTYGGSGGFGTVFQLTPSGTLTTLHAFTGGADGGHPEGAILRTADGDLYGTTHDGGDPTCSCGVLFRLAPDGTETILHAFVGNDGSYPYPGDLTEKHQKLYGTTPAGGQHDNGVVFQLKLK